ncbi:MAG TPA: SprT-like domain-containing protein [Pedococcus sp.]
MDPRAALALARGLLAEHGLHDWRVGLDRAKTRAGACRFARREITLSAPLTRLHSEAEVRDTILHEVAHALVGPSHGHDDVWRATALRIGCSGQRCVPADAPRVEGAWRGTCARGHVRHRHRRPQRPVSCGTCSRTFDVRHLLEWTHHGRRADLGPAYAAQVAALRAAADAADAAVAAAPPGSLEHLARTLWGDAAAVPRPRLVRGARGRCLAPGRYHGVVGEVVKVGRTRYHLRVPAGVLTVPFALVEAA